MTQGEDEGAAQPRARRRRRRLLGLAALALLLLPNAFAAAHAWSLTHYASGGERPRPPQELTASERLARLALGVRVPRPENDAVPWGPYDIHPIDVGDASEELEAWRVLLLDRTPRAEVLLVPGYGASKSSLLAAARRWHARGVVPTLLDPRGVGGSSGSSTTLGAREAEDVALAARRLRVPGRKLLVHGSSQGAAAALRAVARHGAAVDGLVLESCYGRLTDTVRARVRLMGAPPSPGAELLVLWGSLLGGFDGFGLAPVEDAARLQAEGRGVPALLLHGDADPTVPVEAARELAGALGPRARLVLLPGVGHVSLLGAAPDAWEAATSALLDEVAR